MSKHFILAENKENNYTLILRVKENDIIAPCPYVVAWLYDSNTDSWAQGHYFTDLKAALMYMMFKEEYNEIYEVLKDKLESPF